MGLSRINIVFGTLMLTNYGPHVWSPCRPGSRTTLSSQKSALPRSTLTNETAIPQREKGITLCIPKKAAETASGGKESY